MNIIFPRNLVWVFLALLSAPCLAATMAKGEPAGLQPLTLAEALAAYHQSGEIEAFQCVHVPVGKNSEVGKIPLAVELDNMIYLKIDGRLVGVDRIKSSDMHSRYLSKTTRVDVFIQKTTNTSEYGEASNRQMLLRVVNGGRTFSIKTFGAACGI